MTTTLDRSPAENLALAEAADCDANHAYESARRSGCPKAVLSASQRTAQTWNAVLLARHAVMSPAERAEAENDHQNAGPYSHL